MKILVCCANGAGTSLMMRMTCEKAAKALGIEIEELKHGSLAEGKENAANYDLLLCPLNFTSMFKEAEQNGVKVIGLKNVMSQVEMEQKLKDAGLSEK